MNMVPRNPDVQIQLERQREDGQQPRSEPQEQDSIIQQLLAGTSYQTIQQETQKQLSFKRQQNRRQPSRSWVVSEQHHPRGADGESVGKEFFSSTRTAYAYDLL